MNTKNSKTSRSQIFRLVLAGKLDLKNPNKNIALANLSICFTHGKTLNLHLATTNLRYLLQCGMINLICLTVHILFLTFKTILSTLLKNMRL